MIVRLDAWSRRSSVPAGKSFVLASLRDPALSDQRLGKLVDTVRDVLGWEPFVTVTVSGAEPAAVRPDEEATFGAMLRLERLLLQAYTGTVEGALDVYRPNPWFVQRCLEGFVPRVLATPLPGGNELVVCEHLEPFLDEYVNLEEFLERGQIPEIRMALPGILLQLVWCLASCQTAIPGFRHNSYVPSSVRLARFASYGSSDASVYFTIPLANTAYRVGTETTPRVVLVSDWGRACALSDLPGALGAPGKFRCVPSALEDVRTMLDGMLGVLRARPESLGPGELISRISELRSAMCELAPDVVSEPEALTLGLAVAPIDMVHRGHPSFATRLASLAEVPEGALCRRIDL